MIILARFFFNLRSKYLLLPGVCFAALSLAQQPDTEALKQALLKAASDSVRCSILTTLAETAPDGEWEDFNTQLGVCARQAFNSSANPGLKRFYARSFALALNNKGIIWQRLSVPLKEEACYRSAYNVFAALGDQECMATSLSNIGTLHLIGRQNDSALSYFMKSYALSQAAGDLSGAASSLMSMGNICHNQSKIPEALDLYERSLKLSVESGDDWQTALTLRKIGKLYCDLYEYEKAVDYFKKAMVICKKTGDMSGYSEILAAMSVISINRKDFALAEKGFLECLAINNQYGFVFRNADVLLHLGELQLFYHNNDSAALNYFSRAREALTDEHSELAGSIAGRLSRLYSLRGETNLARQFGEAALPFALRFNNADIARNAGRVLLEVYTQSGNYKRALETATVMSTLSDSIFNAQNRLSAVRSQYRSEYVMKAVTDSLETLREKERYEGYIANEKKQRYFLLMFFLIVMLLSLLLFQKMRHRQKLKVANLRNDIAGDLHDEVGASINSIRLAAGFGVRSADLQERESSLKTIEETSMEIARSMSDIIWCVKPGNDSVVLLLDRMQRSGQELCRYTPVDFAFRRGQISGNPGLSAPERKNIYLICREAINNCLRHARAKTIEVLVSFDNRTLRLEVLDDGCGFDDTNTVTGNGLFNMKRRAATINAELTISSVAGQYTKVTLECRTSKNNQT